MPKDSIFHIYIKIHAKYVSMDFPGGPLVKHLPADAEDMG